MTYTNILYYDTMRPESRTSFTVADSQTSAIEGIATGIDVL